MGPSIADEMMAGVYQKGNLCCYVSNSANGFTINYYLAAEPVNPLGIWSTLVTDTTENPYLINGPYGEFKLIMSFNNGVFQCWDKSYKSYSLATLSGDLTGCEDGQLHLSGEDAEWNCMHFDLIVEYSEATGLVTVVKNSSYSIAD